MSITAYNSTKREIQLSFSSPFFPPSINCIRACNRQQLEMVLIIKGRRYQNGLRFLFLYIHTIMDSRNQHILTSVNRVRLQLHAEHVHLSRSRERGVWISISESFVLFFTPCLFKAALHFNKQSLCNCNHILLKVPNESGIRYMLPRSPGTLQKSMVLQIKIAPFHSLSKSFQSREVLEDTQVRDSFRQTHVALTCVSMLPCLTQSPASCFWEGQGRTHHLTALRQKSLVDGVSAVHCIKGHAQCVDLPSSQIPLIQQVSSCEINEQGPAALGNSKALQKHSLRDKGREVQEENSIPFCQVLSVSKNFLSEEIVASITFLVTKSAGTEWVRLLLDLTMKNPNQVL